MSEATDREWVRGFVESFVTAYVDARLPDLAGRVSWLERRAVDLAKRVAELKAGAKGGAS